MVDTASVRCLAEGKDFTSVKCRLTSNAPYPKLYFGNYQKFPKNFVFKNTCKNLVLKTI